MKTFTELKNELDKRKNEELNKTGIFYAFSNEQFEENKTHKGAQDSEYLHIFGGAYIHKNDKEKLDNYTKNIVPQLEKEFTNQININDLIDYELINHECWYTGNWMKIVPLISSYYPNVTNDEIIEKVKKIYNAHPERLDW